MQGRCGCADACVRRRACLSHSLIRVCVNCGEDWSDATLRSLGRLPLPQLHTLHLINKREEAGVPCRFDRVTFWNDDPDFPWGRRDDDGQHWRRALLLHGMTLDGLRALLQLPALTALQLPWIKDSVLEQFRQLTQQQGRAALRIQRSVPLSRRSLLERHWLNVEQPAAGDL